jgi:hypothetical protein
MTLAAWRSSAVVPERRRDAVRVMAGDLEVLEERLGAAGIRGRRAGVEPGGSIPPPNTAGVHRGHVPEKATCQQWVARPET